MVTETFAPAVRQVRAGALRVNVADAGAGPAILLLHGWPHTWLLWRDVIAALAPTHRVIAPDLRGLGGTDTPGDGYDLHTLADDAAALLDALGVERLALAAGIDLGARSPGCSPPATRAGSSGSR